MTECLNEFFILISSYFLILFSDFVPDVETRYFYGDVLMYILIAVIAIDCLMFVIQVVLYVVWRVRMHYVIKGKEEKLAKINE